jgi:hypothetical protein
VATELTQTAKDYAVVMGRSKNALEFALDTLAREATSALARGGGNHGGGILPADRFGPSGPDGPPSQAGAARPALEKGSLSSESGDRAASWWPRRGVRGGGGSSARALSRLCRFSGH